MSSGVERSAPGGEQAAPGGEQTGLTAFREAQLPRVRAYVSVVCSPDRAEEAVSAAFVDFLARADGEPDRRLLGATRSAAAGRFLVVVPQGRPELSLSAECRAMPELLALHAGGERPGDEALLAEHLAGCAICAHTLRRIQEAERMFARGSGELPALEIEVTTVDTTKRPPRAARRPGSAAARPSGSAPAAVATSPPGPSERLPNPIPQPESNPRSDVPGYGRAAGTGETGGTGATYRRRSGGLVGAIRSLGRARRAE